jgi:hypothetical protein
LGIGDWAQSPIPNPQSPIPNPQSPLNIIIIYYLYLILVLINFLKKYITSIFAAYLYFHFLIYIFEILKNQNVVNIYKVTFHL